jgi:hypothetical protein
VVRAFERRGQAEENSRQQRNRKGKADDHRRRRGVDWHVVLVREGERQQRVRSEVGDYEPEQPAHARKKHAFGKQLADDAAALRTEGRADGELRAAAHAADEQKIGDVGAGDEKDECCDPLQKLQVVLVAVLHVLDAAAAGRQHNMRKGKDLLGALICKCLERRIFLFEQRTGLGLQRWD